MVSEGQFTVKHSLRKLRPSCLCVLCVCPIALFRQSFQRLLQKSFTGLAEIHSLSLHQDLSIWNKVLVHIISTILILNLRIVCCCCCCCVEYTCLPMLVLWVHRYKYDTCVFQMHLNHHHTCLNKPFMLIAEMVPGEQGWGLQEVAQAVTYIHHDTLPS